MQIPLVLVLWEHQNYGGIKRTLIEDVDALGITNFNDKTTSIGVHAGPDENALGFQPTVSLYQHPAFEGVEVVLPVGLYPNLNLIGLGDAFSSARFNYAQVREPGIYRSGAFQPLRPQGLPAPMDLIPLVVDLCALYHPDPGAVVGIPGWGGGTRFLTVLESTMRIQSTYGSDFNDAIVAARVRPGPSHEGQVVKLHRDPGFRGGSITLPADGQVVELESLGFSRVTSAVEFAAP